MKRKPATDSLITRLKREAKQRTDEVTTYTQALDQLAHECGYEDWRALAMANGLRNAEVAREFRLDPTLPPNFDNTPNEERSPKQLREWWNKPFILSRSDGTYDVRCLCSGAWDRSTWWGRATSLDEADELASKKLAEWMQIESRPIASIRNDGLIDVVVMDQLPGEPPRTIYMGLTQDEARKMIFTPEDTGT